MNDAELFAFLETFNDVRRVFPLRGDDQDLRQVGLSYFKAMRRFPLLAVQSGADAWLQKGERFPKPAQWIESIPTRRRIQELQALSADAACDHLRAEGLRYEDAACRCSACHTSGVTDKPLRFAPDVDADGLDALALIGDRIVVTGHWAHGDELARWYAAKNAFWARMFNRFGVNTPQQQRRVKKTFEQRMTEIFREPLRTDSGQPGGPTQAGEIAQARRGDR